LDNKLYDDLAPTFSKTLFGQYVLRSLTIQNNRNLNRNGPHLFKKIIFSGRGRNDPSLVCTYE
jgi:hypothetical protein